jgi:sporulation protein YlmC with PRC-barrel domain
MQDDTALTESDKGKSVINQDGDTIGRVMDVENGTAHVDPDPGLADTIMSKLGWSDKDTDTYRLESKRVESVTEDEIRVDM